MHPSLRQIGQLQAWRGHKGRDLSIAGTVQMTADNATRVQRRLGELIDVWREVVPPRIADRTALASLRNGVLQVTVDSAATAFEIDRLLRSGLDGEIRRRFRGNLTRIRTNVGTLDVQPAPARHDARASTSAGQATRTGNTPRHRPKQPNGA